MTLEELINKKPTKDPYMEDHKPDPEREELEDKLEKKDEHERGEREKKGKEHHNVRYLSEAMFCVAGVLMENSKAEAEANEGYTKQLDAIKKLQGVAVDCGNTEIVAWCTKAMKNTIERMSDESNHNLGQLKDFEDLTGIKPAKY